MKGSKKALAKSSSAMGGSKPKKVRAKAPKALKASKPQSTDAEEQRIAHAVFYLLKGKVQAQVIATAFAISVREVSSYGKRHERFLKEENESFQKLLRGDRD